jgi:malate synthase
MLAYFWASLLLTKHKKVIVEGRMISLSTKNIYSLIDLKKNVPFSYKQVLSCKALKFIADIHLNFNERRLELLSSLNGSSNSVSYGKIPESFTRTKNIRNGELAYELTHRKIEIITPSERDLIKEALFSSSCLFILDFENKRSSSWENIIDGQINIKDIITDNTLSDTSEYADSETLVEKIIPLLVRPRSLYLDENNFLIDKEPVSAAFFDFGLFFYHNAKKLVEQGFAPYFYLPSVESHSEAKLWNDVFIFAEEQLRLPIGITKAAA